MEDVSEHPEITCGTGIYGVGRCSYIGNFTLVCVLQIEEKLKGRIREENQKQDAKNKLALETFEHEHATYISELKQLNVSITEHFITMFLKARMCVFVYIHTLQCCLHAYIPVSA